MTWLEIIGSISIFLYCYELYKNKYPHKFSKDPNLNKRHLEFNQMSTAFDRLHDLRDQEADPHNKNISNVQSALELLIHYTVPLPKESFASDFKSKHVDYAVIYNLASAIIKSEISSGKVEVAELKVQ